MSAPGNPKIRYEDKDLSFKPIVWSAVGLAVATVFFCALMWGLFHFLAARVATRGAPANPLAAQHGHKEPPEPRLLADPRITYEEFRDHENHLMNSYGWEDKRFGLVRVPIERAMKNLAEIGLPVQPGVKAAERAE